MTHCRRVGNRRNFAYFSLWHPKYGRQGIQKGLRGSEDRYIPADQIGCDRSIVVCSRSRNDRQTSWQTDKQNGMTIELSLCEGDATDIPTDRPTDGIGDNCVPRALMLTLHG